MKPSTIRALRDARTRKMTPSELLAVHGMAVARKSRIDGLDMDSEAGRRKMRVLEALLCMCDIERERELVRMEAS